MAREIEALVEKARRQTDLRETMKTRGMVRTVEELVERVGRALAANFPEVGAARSSNNVTRGRKPNSRRLDMTCRVPGCQRRSGGPRNRYMCDKHEALPKAKKDRFLAAYRQSKV